MSVCDLKVLRAMVHKLSVELGREQGRRRETGCQLEDGDDEEAEWLTELGGLVPLLVAYEEELREVKAAKKELQQVVEKDQVGEVMSKRISIVEPRFLLTQLKNI